MADVGPRMPSPRFARLIAGLPATVPFVGPEAQERTRGRRFRARIGANESVFGPSPRAVEAMRAAAAQSWMYGDPEMHELKAAHRAPPRRRAGQYRRRSGIDSLLGLAVRMTVEPGRGGRHLGGRLSHVQLSRRRLRRAPRERAVCAATARTPRRCWPPPDGSRRRWSTSPIPTAPWDHGGVRPTCRT